MGRDAESTCRRQELEHQGIAGKETLSPEPPQDKHCRGYGRGDTSWRNSRGRRSVTHSTHFLKRQSRE